MTLRLIKLLIKALTTPQAIELLKYILEVVVSTEEVTSIGVQISKKPVRKGPTPPQQTQLQLLDTATSLAALGYSAWYGGGGWLVEDEQLKAKWHSSEAKLFIEHIGSGFVVRRCETEEQLVTILGGIGR